VYYPCNVNLYEKSDFLYVGCQYGRLSLLDSLYQHFITDCRIFAIGKGEFTLTHRNLQFINLISAVNSVISLEAKQSINVKT
jgi:hypothetical protein